MPVLPTISIGQACYAERYEALSLSVTDQHTLLLLCDGAGSWGDGMQAALTTNQKLVKWWQESDDHSLEQFQTQIEQVHTQISAEPVAEEDFPPAFSLLALVLSDHSCMLLRAGIFGIWLRYKDQWFYQTHFPLLEHPGSTMDVYFSSVMGESSPVEVENKQFSELQSGDLLIVAHYRVFKFLQQLDTDHLESILSSDHSAMMIQTQAHAHKLANYPCAVVRW